MNSRCTKRKKLEGTNTTNIHGDLEGKLRSSEDSTEPKVKHERSQATTPGYDESVLLVEKDEGFPLITSVYSLADCVGTEPLQDNCNLGGVSPDKVTSQQLPSGETGTSIGNGAMSDRRDLNDAATSNVSYLPFVVQCTNGVITVSSPPPGSSTATITKSITTLQPDHKQKSRTSSSTTSPNFQTTNSFGGADGAFPASKTGILPVLQTNECQQVNQGYAILPRTNTYQSPKATSANVNQRFILPKPIQNSAVESNFKVELKPSVVQQSNAPNSVDNNLKELHKSSSSQVEGSTSSDHFINEISSVNKQDSFTTATISGEEHLSSRENGNSKDFPNPDHSLREEKEELPFVTKQDDRIRRLKDLLRQKEDDLEKLRFKKNCEIPDSPSPRALDTGERQLRIKLLKKKSGKELDKVKQSIQSDAQSESVPSKLTGSRAFIPPKPALTKEDQPKPKKELLGSVPDTKVWQSTQPSILKRKNSELELPYKVLASPTDGQVACSPPKRKPGATVLKQPNALGVTDKYRLVNVTVIDGHTRTLAVPVDNKREPGTSSKNQVKETTAKSVQTVGEVAGSNTPGKCDVWVPPVCKPIAATANVFSSECSNHLCTSKANASTNKPSSPRLNQPSDMASNKDSENHPNQRSTTNSSENGNKNSDVAVTQGTTFLSQGTTPSVNSSTTKKVLGTLEFHSNQSLNNHPSPAPIANINNCPSKTSGAIVTQGNSFTTSTPPNTSHSNQPLATLKIPTNTLLNNTPQVSSTNTNTPWDRNPSVAITHNSTLPKSATLKTSAPEVCSAVLNVSSNKALENISNQVYTITASAYTGRNADHGLQQIGTVVTCAHSSNNLVSRPLHALAPKLPLVPVQDNSGGKQNEKLLIYSLPKPDAGGTVAAPCVKLNDVVGGKILLCNVVQRGATPKPQEVFLSTANNDPGKVVFYVSNPGTVTKPEVREDKKVISAVKPCLAPKKNEEVTAKSPVQRDDNSEFIPNPDDPDFTKLLGLEHVVSSLNSDL